MVTQLTTPWFLVGRPSGQYHRFMGGAAITLKLEPGGRDLERLQRRVWNILYRRVLALATSKASRRVDFEYLHVCVDELEGGSFFARGDSLVFGFGDGAGLCYAEMYATLHWTKLVLLDAWKTVDLAARDHGTALAPAGDLGAELGRLLGRSERVFFPVGGALAYAAAASKPAAAHPVELSATSTTLGALAPRERAVAERAIRSGICSCDVCTKLRKRHHVEVGAAEPPGPEERKRAAKAATPKRGARASSTAHAGASAAAVTASLADVAFFDHPSPKELTAPARLGPAGAAVDWRVEHSEKASRAVLDKLAALPVRALGLTGHGMKAVPDAVLASSALEALGLHKVSLKECPMELARLTSLRALDLSWNKLDPAEVAELVLSLPSLEVIDFDDWGRATPPSLGRHRALRHLNLWRECGATPFIEAMPLESLIASEPLADLRALPLRFLHVTTDVPLPPLPKLEMLAVAGDGALPESVRAMKGLRALYVDGAAELPPWLAELPLEMLVVRGDGLDGGVSGFRAIERVTSLRALSVIGERDLSLDLKRLSSLEVLLAHGEKLDDVASFPRGLQELPRLRAVRVGTFGKLRLGDVERCVPSGCSVLSEVNGVRVLEPVDVFRAWALTASAPEWWLSRFRKGASFVDVALALAPPAPSPRRGSRP